MAVEGTVAARAAVARAVARARARAAAADAKVVATQVAVAKVAAVREAAALVVAAMEEAAWEAGMVVGKAAWTVVAMGVGMKEVGGKVVEVMAVVETVEEETAVAVDSVVEAMVVVRARAEMGGGVMVMRQLRRHAPRRG